MDNVLFGCKGLELSFAGRNILSGVSLSLNSGELLGLVGPNGAGKTSLFEVFCGRYKSDCGSVFLEGKDITRQGFYNRTQSGLRRTFQSPIVPMSLSVAETFRATRKAWKPYLSRHDAEWAARLAHLTVNWETPAATLGAFDRRKLILACILMRRPKVILMDEPASGLINAEIDELELIIRRLVDEYHMGVVLIEHRLELLAAVADRTVVLDLGKVIAEGTPEDVFLNPRVKAAYFENVDA